MNILVLGMSAFAAGFALHALLSRWCLAWRRPGRLLLAFALAYAIIWVGLWTAPQVVSGLGLVALTSVRWLHLALFMCTLLAFYFLFYMGVIDDSPTLTVIRMIWRQGAKGMEEKHLHAFFTDERFLLPRLAYMEQKGMIRLEGGRYRLAKGGERWLAWLGPIQNFTRMGRPG